ncbi:hypothetical protein GS506_06335 [Rhodococcus hoagii]|nr:hypothetical protein [Prescottella equi]
MPGSLRIRRRSTGPRHRYSILDRADATTSPPDRPFPGAYAGRCSWFAGCGREEPRRPPPASKHPWS